jgi:hypothetical protein
MGEPHLPGELKQPSSLGRIARAEDLDPDPLPLL